METDRPCQTFDYYPFSLVSSWSEIFTHNLTFKNRVYRICTDHIRFGIDAASPWGNPDVHSAPRVPVDLEVLDGLESSF